MKRKKNVLPLTLCASVFLHTLLFLFLTINSKPLAVVPKASPAVFSLVSVRLREPEPVPQPEPEEVLPRQAVSPPPPEPEEVLPRQVASPPPADLPAEIFIPVEEIPPAGEPSGPTETPPSFEARTVPAAAAPPVETRTGEKESAPVSAYVRRNYAYIQRRIKDRLRYPSQARRTGVQGTAEIHFTILTDGTVSGITIRESSGQELLDQAAVKAVLDAAPFPPPPAPARLAIPLSFKLRY